MYPPSKYSPEYTKPWKPLNNSGCCQNSCGEVLSFAPISRHGCSSSYYSGSCNHTNFGPLNRGPGACVIQSPPSTIKSSGCAICVYLPIDSFQATGGVSMAGESDLESAYNETMNGGPEVSGEAD